MTIKLLLIIIPFITLYFKESLIIFIIERLCGSGWLILKGVYKRIDSVALIY